MAWHIGEGTRPGRPTGVQVIELGEVHRACNQVLLGRLPVDAGVVLIATALRRDPHQHILQVGHAIKTTARVVGGEYAELRGASGCERADVQATTYNRTIGAEVGAGRSSILLDIQNLRLSGPIRAGSEQGIID